jgi:hypothetical protein
MEQRTASEFKLSEMCIVDLEPGIQAVMGVLSGG